MKIILLTMFMGIAVSGCSSYPNKFYCDDARGLGCTMLRDVDMQIDSGAIETVYASANSKKNCSNNGKNCLNQRDKTTKNVLESRLESRAWWSGDENNGADVDNRVYF